jgi:sterol desaturase/sphingolipid hydroxylase (fatty acid hydroxylase superfamily)
LADPTILAIPYYVAGIAIERRAIARRRADRDRRLRGYAKDDARTSITAGATALVAWIPLNLLSLATMQWCWTHRVADLGTGPLAWLLALVAVDLSFYWQDRAEHEVRFLWGGHVTHHSSTYYNLSTALRQSWTPWTGFAFYSVWAWLGIAPGLLVTSFGLNLLYQFWIHTEAIDRLPAWIEAIFNTPSHHRVHHGSNPRYLDKNYGGISILWDRAFGTFEPERERVVYGLTKPLHGDGMLHVQLHEYAAMWRDVRAARTWGDALGYLLRFPGWTPAREPEPRAVSAVPAPVQ